MAIACQTNMHIVNVLWLAGSELVVLPSNNGINIQSCVIISVSKQSSDITKARNQNYAFGISSILFSIPLFIIDLDGIINVAYCFVLFFGIFGWAFYAGIITGLIGIWRDKSRKIAIIGLITHATGIILFEIIIVYVESIVGICAP